MRAYGAGSAASRQGGDRGTLGPGRAEWWCVSVALGGDTIQWTWHVEFWG